MIQTLNSHHKQNNSQKNQKSFINYILHVIKIIKDIQQSIQLSKNITFIICKLSKKGLKRKYISNKNIDTIYLYALKIWGNQYFQKDYIVFLMNIISKLQSIPIENIKNHLISIKQKQIAKTSRSSQQSQSIKSLQSSQEISSKKNIHNNTTKTINFSSILSLECSSLIQLKQQLSNYLEYLLMSFSQEEKVAYFKNKGSLKHIAEQCEQSESKVTVNIMMDSQLFKMNNSQHHVITSNSCNSKLSSQLSTQQPSVKLTYFNIFDYQTIIQTQIKKTLLDQSLLIIIQNIQSLQLCFDYLRRFGSHPKNIYYQESLFYFYHNKYNHNHINNHHVSYKVNDNINKIIKLCKKFYVKYQIINVDYRNDNLLYRTLNKIDKIKSHNKNYTNHINTNTQNNINLPSNKNFSNQHNQHNQHNQNNDRQQPQTANEIRPSDKTIKPFNQKQAKHPQHQPAQRRTQKPTIILQQPYNFGQLSQQKQSQSHKFGLIITLLSKYTQRIYYKLNLPPNFISLLELKQIYLYIINYNNQNQDNQISLEQKIYLIFKVIEEIRKCNYQPINKEIRKILEDMYKNIQKEIISVNNNVNNNNVNNNNANNNSTTTTNGRMSLLNGLQLNDSKIDLIIQKLQKINLVQQNYTLNVINKKINKFKFTNQCLNYILKYFDNQEQQFQDIQTSDLQDLLKKAIKMFNNLKNSSNIPANIKRNSRKSINAFFKKQSIKQKLSSPQNAALLALSISQSKKNNFKRVSKNSIKIIAKQSKAVSSQISSNQQSKQQKDNNFINVNELFYQIELKKNTSKINYLVNKIQSTILSLLKFDDNKSLVSMCQKQHEETVCDNLSLIMMILQEELPGPWHIILNTLGTTNNIIEIFKYNLKIQQDISFSLQKIKRSKHSQINFNYLKYPKQYIQTHFGTKISSHTNNIGQIFLISNNPNQQQLDQSLGYIKISSIQTFGWKFSAQNGFIDIIQQSTASAQNKQPITCVIIRKFSQIGLNIIPIEVYESKCSTKPLFKVYGTCKKNANFSTGSNSLGLYLKEEQEI